nr:hypothetical protein [Nocardioides convexus]
MSEQPEISHATVDDGTARLTWTADLTDRGWQAAVDVVRRQVAEALTDHDRVEVKVAVDDAEAQRIATWSGLRREGVQRGRGGDVVVYARLVDDTPVHEPGGFRALLNSFLPRKRGIAQMLVRDESPEPRVLLCEPDLQERLGPAGRRGRGRRVAARRGLPRGRGGAWHWRSPPARCCSPTGCRRGAAGTTHCAWSSTAGCTPRRSPSGSCRRPGRSGARSS